MSCACENICDSYTVIVCVRQCCNGDVLASRSVCIATIYIYPHGVIYYTDYPHSLWSQVLYFNINSILLICIYIYARVFV